MKTLRATGDEHERGSTVSWNLLPNGTRNTLRLNPLDMPCSATCPPPRSVATADDDSAPK